MAFELFKLYGSIFVDNAAANSAMDETATKSETLQRSFGDVATKAGNVSKATGTLGSGLTKYVTAPLAAVGTAAVAAFNRVDDGMDVVISKTGATGETAQQLEEVYRSVGKTVPASFDDIGAAVGEVNTRFGFTGDQLETASTKFLEFSKITGVDTTEGVRLVSRAMSDAGIDTSEYTTVLDQLSKASQASGIEVSTLTENLAKYGAPMRALGFDTQESISIFSGWEKAGVNTEIAFSGMKKAISNWSAEGKDAKVEFGNTLKEIQSAPDIASATSLAIEAFGQKAGPDLADAIQNGRFSYEEFMEIIQNSEGTLDSTYNEMLDGGDRIKTAWNNIKIAGADLGESVLNVVAPAFESLASTISKVGDWFSALSPGMQDFIVKIGAVTAAIGPALLAVSKISGKIGEFSEWMSKAGEMQGFVSKLVTVKGGFIALTGPVLAVIAAIAAFTAILVGAWQNSEQFRDSVTGAWTRIQQGAQQCFSKIQTALAPVIQTFQELWAQVQPVLQQIGDMLATYVVPIIESVVAFVLTSITNIITGIAPLLSAVGNILSVIVNVVGMVVALINGDWNGAMEFGKQALQSLWDAVVNIWNGIWGTISALLSIICNGIKTAWDNILSTATTLMSNLWNAFSTGFTNLWTSVVGWATTVVTNIWNALKNLLQTGADALSNLSSGISSGFSTLWGSVSGWAGQVVTNISSALSGLWQLGSDVMADFSDGIKSGFESLWTNITSWCGTVVDKFKEALGIASPSKVMTELGGFVTEGFFNGLSAADWGSFATGIMDQVVEAFKNGGATLSALVSKLGSGITSILSSMGVDLSGLFGGSGSGNVQSLGGLLWPTTSSSITSWFGYRDDTGGVGSTYHQGLDIGAGYGEPIYAAADGQVEIAGGYGGYGNAVKLANGDGIETLYGHMSAIAVGAGDIVSKGQVIGYVGSTGNSTGPHLHFSVLVNGEQVDPAQFFGLAKGGIVKKPIWTKLGEAGESEAVVPLSKASSMGFGGITKADLNEFLEKITDKVKPVEINEYFYNRKATPAEVQRANEKALRKAGLASA